MNNLKAISINVAIPFFVALIFAFLVYYQEKIPSFIFDIMPYIFYVLSAIVIVISWHFNRNRFLFVLFPLVLLYIGFEFLPASKATLLFKYISIIFPLHLLIFLILSERGLFSLWGNLKIAFVVLELAIIVWFVEYPNSMILDIFNIKLFVFDSFPLSDVSIVVGLFILFIMLSLVLFNHFLMYNGSFLLILISLYATLYFVKINNVIELGFIAIVLIILVLLIREAYRLAFYDELTSLPGRRALIEDMAKLGRKYTLAMCDIDHFKKFNDTYGHDTGDEVLKMVATKLANVGGGGKAYRYGGEEFTLLFPSKDVDESYIYADILRENIAKSPFVVRNKKSAKKIFINISAGIVQNSAKDKDPFATMKRADNALYKAKDAGRNKVVKA
ncbi:MAG: GGDEF domain-containing protein [Thiovulaceae bacterium]|nr:GGDEF domain-containing protein [Sulfurimonadaceae bacterium]